MSLRNRNREVPSRVAVKSVLAIAAVLSLSFLVACGSSSQSGQAPPTGGFGNSNLSGTYAFSVEGLDINGCIIAIAGTFSANGKGGIDGGAIDVVEPCFSTTGLLVQGAAVTGGYNVGADGRPESSGGLLNLATASNGTYQFDYVLSSNNGGLITYYSTSPSQGGSGSGSFELQTTVSQTNINGQSYAFSTSGVSNPGLSETPFVSAGAFTLDGNGDVGDTTTGIGDVNNSELAQCGADGCAMTAGNITLSSTAGAPGTATMTLSPFGVFTFDVYPVTPTQLIFIETDGARVTVGNAFTQASFPVGNNVFAVAGFDYTVDDPTASVGLLVTNGAGGVTTASTQDVNDAGTSFEVAGLINGSYTTPATGRSVITLNGFINEGGGGCLDCQFAAYPSTGGMQLIEIDNAGITSGAVYAQSGSPTFATGQGYGMDLTGSNLGLGAEEDDIAEFTYGTTCTGGANLCGLIDFNDVTTGSASTLFAQGYTGSYAADSSGISGRGTVTPGNNAYGMATYVVDGSTSVAVVNDTSGMVALGTISTQSSTTAASAKAVQQHLATMRAASLAGKHLKKNKER